MAGRVLDATGTRGTLRAIDRLFTSDVIDRLARIRRASDSPFDKAGAVFRNRHTFLSGSAAAAGSGARAMRRAWASYVDAADDYGLLDDPEFVAALVGDDDDAFRGALAECCVASFLSSLPALRVRARPEAKSGKNVDMRVMGGGIEFDVEVKAPFVPRTSNHWRGTDTKAILASIKDAGTQFKRNRKNLLVLVPTFRTPVHHHRGQLVEAVLGQRAISVHVSLDGSDPPPPEPTFVQNGKLARLRRTQGGDVSTDFTRIGAIMSIEQRYRDLEDDEVEVRQAVVVVHNPFATQPINASVFRDVPQLVRDGHVMRWTDEYTGV